MKIPALSLIVLRSANVEAALAFYGSVGLVFVKEQHGSGPIHYSAELSGLVLEIYPAQTGTASEPKASGATMLGIQVGSLDEALAKLQELHIESEAPPKDSDWGRWVNVTDPDGRVIQLIQT